MRENQKPQTLYPISEAVKMTGVSMNTIKNTRAKGHIVFWNARGDIRKDYSGQGTGSGRSDPIFLSLSGIQKIQSLVREGKIKPQLKRKNHRKPEPLLPHVEELQRMPTPGEVMAKAANAKEAEKKEKAGDVPVGGGLKKMSSEEFDSLMAQRQQVATRVFDKTESSEIKKVKPLNLLSVSLFGITFSLTLSFK